MHAKLGGFEAGINKVTLTEGTTVVFSWNCRRMRKELDGKA